MTPDVTPVSNQEIPVLDLSPEINALWDELNAVFQGVLRDGHFIMGEAVRLFEREVADFLGVKHAVGLNSGTDALVIGLRAMGIGPGDEVITTPFTFFASVECIDHVGATPVLVDIDPRTYNLDVNQIEARITPRTKAIIPVHLYGLATDMDAIMALAAKYNLLVMEDVAQAFGGTFNGRRLSTIGDLGTLSFFPSKNLGGFGDGGMIVTNKDTFADEARMLRVHGSRRKYHNETLGYNSRLDTLQAALLRVKLPHIPEWNEGRRRAAKVYDELLGGVPGITLPIEIPGAGHVYHQYTIRVAEGKRDALQAHLKAAGISTMVYYPVPINHLPFYAGKFGPMPHAEQAAHQVLSLPIWPQIERTTQERVAHTIRGFISA